MKIIGIESKNGVFITDNVENERYHNSYIRDKFFDDVTPESTYHKDWFLIKKAPNKITRKVTGKCVNYRFELKDKSFLSEVIKDSFLREDVIINEDGDYADNFKNIHSLYELNHDKEDDYFEDVEFEYVKLMEVDKIPELKTFSYVAQMGSYRHNGMGFVTEKNIKHQLIDEIIFPAPLLHTRPCSLSSEMSYKIVREYVKLNIDPEYAEITSDYDFCFTVKKKIHLSEKESYQIDVNNNLFSKRKRKPKMVAKYRSHRSVEIFEMTHSPKSYGGYTPIIGFKGDNNDDLIKNIENYLQKIIAEINKPLHDCPHCQGLGVMEFSKIKTNK